MSRQNVEIVRAALDAYFREDEDALTDLITPDSVVQTRPDQPDVSEYYGYEGLMKMGAEWVDAWADHAIEVTRIWDVGDAVFVRTQESGHGKMSGAPMRIESTFLFTVRQKEIVRLQIFGSEREALEARGLAD